MNTLYLICFRAWTRCTSYVSEREHAVPHVFQSVNTLYQKEQEEKEALLMQLKFLIERNQDLLGHALNDKDQFSGQEKSYMYAKHCS